MHRQEILTAEWNNWSFWCTLFPGCRWLLIGSAARPPWNSAVQRKAMIMSLAFERNYLETPWQCRTTFSCEQESWLGSNYSGLQEGNNDYGKAVLCKRVNQVQVLMIEKSSKMWPWGYGSGGIQHEPGSQFLGCNPAHNFLGVRPNMELWIDMQRTMLLEN